MSTQRSPPWDPQLVHSTNGHTASPQSPNLALPPAFLPNGSKSLSGIALRSVLLGLSCGVSLSMTIYILLVLSSPHWRVPFFLTLLSLFHFLEFYITATYNPAVASVQAFLFSQNGSAYTLAHTLAILECLVSHGLLADYKEALLKPSASGLMVSMGLGMVGVGQGVRSLAMVQAGSNFNHTVQIRKKEGHELVTNGIYAWLRHPSYIGFFWWGLGTLLILGNWL